jgi:hypothetical protein
VLLAQLTGVGRDYPLSIEKLCPVLSFYVVSDWREGCERCKQILRYGGMGHTMSIHSQDDRVILEFGLKKPAFRVIANSPTTHGSIGLTTGLDPSLTLGCGGYGGNITSDNISPRHLLNIKRLAYGITRAESRHDRDASGTSVDDRSERAARRPAGGNGISGDVLEARIDAFLGSRGYRGEAVARPAGAVQPTVVQELPQPGVPSEAEPPLDFVCEEDVRLAIAAGRTLRILERAIVTPAARDLAEIHRVLRTAAHER